VVKIKGLSIMKKIIFSAFIIFFFCPALIHARESKSIGNPAAIYSIGMGYQYEVRTDHLGNEYGFCIFPDKSECNAWDFLKGKAGKFFSYCAKKGYDTETEKKNKGSYYTECAVCVSRDKGNGKQEKILMLELMKKNQEPLIEKMFRPKNKGQRIPKGKNLNKFKNIKKNLCPSFDWREKDGHSYIGPVRNQGGCGSCYSFGAAAAAEGTYNYATGNYDNNCADFSESFIIWCLGSLPEYNSHFYGCYGADYEYKELEALTDEGITWELNYPYTEVDPGDCAHWSDPVKVFDLWNRIDSLDIDAIKTALSTYGVLDVAVYATYNFSNYTGGIFINSDTTCPDNEYTATNHAVSLVGWGTDISHGDYWILRNSWGSSWGENGYMRIGITSARVACACTYLAYTAPALPPVADFNTNKTNHCPESTVTFNDSSTNDPNTWQWTFSPATVTYVNGTNSNSRNPQVQFNSSGSYFVSLYVANSYGNDTTTKSGYITIKNSCQTVKLDLTTDEYAAETTWDLKDSGNTVLYSGGPYNTGVSQNIVEEFRLPYGNYTFTIYDSYGDGICCYWGTGHYSLTNLSTGKVYIDSGGEFGSNESTAFSLAPVLPFFMLLLE